MCFNSLCYLYPVYKHHIPTLRMRSRFVECYVVVAYDFGSSRILTRFPRDRLRVDRSFRRFFRVDMPCRRDLRTSGIFCGTSVLPSASTILARWHVPKDIECTRPSRIAHIP